MIPRNREAGAVAKEKAPAETKQVETKQVETKQAAKAAEPKKETKAEAVPVVTIDNIGLMPLLNTAKTECSIMTFRLVAGTIIYYKASASWVVSVGKIERFMYAGNKQSDTESVWMLIIDAEDGQKEWVSVAVWAEQKEAGTLDVKIIKKIEPLLEAKRAIQF